MARRPGHDRIHDDAAGHRATRWRKLRPDRYGVVPDATLGERVDEPVCDGADDNYPMLVRVGIRDMPRYLVPSPAAAGLRHRGPIRASGGEDDADPFTLLPSQVWDIGDSREEIQALRGLACGGATFDYRRGVDDNAYSEVHTMNVLPLRQPGVGVQVAFRATRERHHVDGSGDWEPVVGIADAGESEGFQELTEVLGLDRFLRADADDT